jgi:enediyne biosynthesis protein E4
MRPSLPARTALALLVAAACAPESAPPPPWHDAAGYRWRELTVPSGRPGFTALASEQTGIRFQNTLSDSVLLGNRILGQGAGVALGDVDGDGLVDVFLARTQGSNALYRNLGGWRFEDITLSSGVGPAGRYSTGAAFADIDGDDDLDLVLLATLGPDAIFLNDGRGHFTEHGKDLGIDASPKGATTAALADVDGDGDLDLYIANYKPYTPIDSLSPRQRAFNQLVRETGPGRFEVVPRQRRDYRIVEREDMGGLSLSIRAEPDDFYLNEGGHFTRVPLTSGRFLDAKGRPLNTEPESFGLAARFADFTGDGAPELYVVNDFEDPDQFWINDGHGRFRLADWTVQRQTSNSGMGADVGDVNGDGLPDLFEVDMLSNDSRRLATQMPTHTPLPKRPGRLEVQLQQQRNTLFLQRDDGTFAEVAAYAGIQASGWSWSTLFLDVDLDGWQDILITNGHVRDVMDADTQERLQAGWDGAPWQQHFFQYPKLPLANVAYRNRGDLSFEDRSAEWGFGTEKDISHGMAAADLDGDGDLDVVVNRLGAPVLLLENGAEAPRIAVRLAGRAPNTRAVGARIRVHAGALPLQQKELAAGGLYLSHSDYLASFAAGAAQRLTLTVDWRDGGHTVLDSVGPNRLYEIRESGSGSPDSLARLPTPVQEPLFEDASAQLNGHVHAENAFGDWDRQYLLPDALSQLGPGIAWFDLDRDGDEDLLIGTGKGGRLGVYRNQSGRLVPEPARGPVAARDLTTVLGLVTGGRSSVLAGVSTWEERSVAEMIAQPAVVGLRAAGTALAAGAEPVIPSHESSVGPLSLADYDGDGDLDLFVGARAIPLRYPEPAASGLFRNEGGRFELDAANSEGLRDIGMVSASLFADVDGDGDPDLLLAREWDSILLLLNQGGRFAPAPDSWGLSRWPSRWNGLAAGDLDGDGRLDLIATSWGRNLMARADSARPLLLYYGPFGAKGEVEMLLAREDPRLRAPAPLDRYERVRTAVPSLAGRFPSFAAYADASIDQLLAPFGSKVRHLAAATLDNMVFLNRGGRFEGVPLPPEAQLAPAFYAGIADFDGDGLEDLFIGQNFSPTSLGAPRYDAGRSLLLLGDGKGGLRPVSGTRSGLIVYGDQRGAGYADFDGDGRLDLVVSQNGTTTRLFHNRGGQAGLRVRLQGPAGNPDAVGAQLRLVYGERMGPLREVQAGSGYWSQNGAVQVLGLAGTPTAVWVRWPGGAETRTAVSAAAREVLVKR